MQGKVEFEIWYLTANHIYVSLQSLFMIYESHLKAKPPSNKKGIPVPKALIPFHPSYYPPIPKALPPFFFHQNR